MLPILYQDQNLIAVDKPSGLLVHRTALTTERENCMAILRDQLGQWVYPVHRLDRATSGVLLFALNPEFAKTMGEMFQQKSVRKFYYAVVRGFLPNEGLIDKPLQKADSEELLPATTKFECLAKVELPFKIGRHETSRYSLAKIETLHGRYHQIRRHMSSISHPLIGDTVYGEGRHNRFFREQFGSHRLLLCAQQVEFEHPETKKILTINAEWPDEVASLYKALTWEHVLQNPA